MHNRRHKLYIDSANLFRQQGKRLRAAPGHVRKFNSCVTRIILPRLRPLYHIARPFNTYIVVDIVYSLRAAISVGKQKGGKRPSSWLAGFSNSGTRAPETAIRSLWLNGWDQRNSSPGEEVWNERMRPPCITTPLQYPFSPTLPLQTSGTSKWDNENVLQICRSCTRQCCSRLTAEIAITIYKYFFEICISRKPRIMFSQKQ